MEGETSIESQTVPVPERFSEAVILKGLRDAFARIMTAANRDAARRDFMFSTRESAQQYFSGREEERAVGAALEELDAALANADERHLERAAQQLTGAFRHAYRDPEHAESFNAHLRQLERDSRHMTVMREQTVPLSPEWMLHGTFNEGGEGEDVFRIHIASAQTLKPLEQLADFRKGMRELARRVARDPAFAGLQWVVGTSWIVGEHPNAPTLLGFTVSEQPLSSESAAHFAKESRRVQQASMTRETLLRLYGEKESP